MKELLIAILICLLPLSLFAATSKVLVVEVWPEVGYSNQKIAHDYTRQQLIAVYQLLDNRGIQCRSIKWNGSIAYLKEHTYFTGEYGYADEYDMAIFVGTRPYDMTSDSYVSPGSSGASDISNWGVPDSTYSILDAVWWFGYGAIPDTSKIKLGSCSPYDYINDSGFTMNTVGYGGALDSFYCYQAGMTSGIALRDSTLIDNGTLTPILTSTGWSSDDDSPSAGHLGVWKLEGDGLTNYYCILRHSPSAAIIDALICKHVDNYDVIDFAMDIDDFGQHKPVAGGYTFTGGFTAGADNNNNHMLTHDNFFSEIDSLFAAVEAYDLKLSVGIQARYVRTDTANGGYAEHNQWDEWYDLAQKYADSDNIQWVTHEGGRECDEDSTTIWFRHLDGRSDYNDYNALNSTSLGDGTPPTVAIIDSIYDACVDSIEAWGLTVAPYAIPNGDDLDGYYGDLTDTIATWAAQNGVTLRARYVQGKPHPDTHEYLGGRFVNAYYVQSSDTTVLTTSDKCQYIWNSMFRPILSGDSYISGQNAGAWDAGTLYGIGRKLVDYEYNPRQARILIFHFAGCLKQGSTTRNQQLVELLGQTINYLEAIAGKDLYECKFAQDLDWEQIK